MNNKKDIPKEIPVWCLKRSEKLHSPAAEIVMMKQHDSAISQNRWTCFMATCNNMRCFPLTSLPAERKIYFNSLPPLMKMPSSLYDYKLQFSPSYYTSSLPHNCRRWKHYFIYVNYRDNERILCRRVVNTVALFPTALLSYFNSWSVFCCSCQET